MFTGSQKRSASSLDHFHSWSKKRGYLRKADKPNKRVRGSRISDLSRFFFYVIGEKQGFLSHLFFDALSNCDRNSIKQTDGVHRLKLFV